MHRVMQLTGLSDLVYAEATVTVNQFDISVDMLVCTFVPITTGRHPETYLRSSPVFVCLVVARLATMPSPVAEACSF